MLRFGHDERYFYVALLNDLSVNDLLFQPCVLTSTLAVDVIFLFRWHKWWLSYYPEVKTQQKSIQSLFCCFHPLQPPPVELHTPCWFRNMWRHSVTPLWQLGGTWDSCTVAPLHSPSHVLLQRKWPCYHSEVTVSFLSCRRPFALSLLLVSQIQGSGTMGAAVVSLASGVPKLCAFLLVSCCRDANKQTKT